MYGSRIHRSRVTLLRFRFDGAMVLVVDRVVVVWSALPCRKERDRGTERERDRFGTERYMRIKWMDPSIIYLFFNLVDPQVGMHVVVVHANFSPVHVYVFRRALQNIHS